MSKYQALIDAPSLHEQIMNLPCVQVNMEPRGSMARLAYKVGHRDARHAAAELAQAQDATIRALLADLERAEKALQAVAAWGPFPRVPDSYSDEPGATVSYAVAFGSNGERDYIRGIAQAALAQMAGGG